MAYGGLWLTGAYGLWGLMAYGGLYFFFFSFCFSFCLSLDL